MKTQYTWLLEPANDAPPAGGTPAPAWHQTIVTKGADGSESLADPATWLDKAPAPLAKFVKDNMTAARAKSEGLKVPGENATPEEIAAFHKALGVPDSPEGYELGELPADKLPEGVTYDPAMEKAFLAKAKDLGLNKRQVEALREFQIQHVGQSVQAQREAMKAVIEAEKAELQKMFGDKLDATLQQAGKLATLPWVPEGMKKYLSEGALDPQSGNFAGPDFVAFAAAVAKATGEDPKGGGVRGAANGMSLDEAKRVMSDSTHPKHALYQKGDSAVMAEVSAAYKAAHS